MKMRVTLLNQEGREGNTVGVVIRVAGVSRN
jgi:hypothetical protein